MNEDKSGVRRLLAMDRAKINDKRRRISSGSGEGRFFVEIGKPSNNLISVIASVATNDSVAINASHKARDEECDGEVEGGGSRGECKRAGDALGAEVNADGVEEGVSEGEEEEGVGDGGEEGVLVEEAEEAREVEPETWG
ncbi:hypothetical protein Scep_009891 [Stephania cephalantha]|uniref:Uncharacterized protein n=1 Tax=Stephania cephalantha TaxID=152367 RepID=A0AAP0JV17_9MAGN